MIITLVNIMDIYPERAELFILAFILKLIYLLGYFPRIQLRDKVDTYRFEFEHGTIIAELSNYKRTYL